jgi:hypothetical protein
MRLTGIKRDFRSLPRKAATALQMFRYGLRAPSDLRRFRSWFELDQNARISAERGPILQMD